MVKDNKATWPLDKNRAACRNMDSELFFGTKDEGPSAKQAREVAAKAVCSRCVLLVECGEQAIKRDIDTGVWGGMTETERQQAF